MALEAGTPAPDFIVKTDGGGEVTLHDFKGKWLVLYFYPKDDTSGCTKEACDFRDNMKRITSKGATVVGVSPDKPESHDKFKEKYNLNFILASDPELLMLNKYDVWKEKSMYGRKYMGVERTTYVIDPEGKIRRVYPKVKVPGHVDQVIAALEELQNEEKS